MRPIEVRKLSGPEAPLGRLHYRMNRASLVLAQPTTYWPIAVLTVVSVGLFATQQPVTALAVLAVGWLGGLARAGLAACFAGYAERVSPAPGPPFDPIVVPCDIHHHELRGTYELILDAHERIRRHLVVGEDVSERLATLYAFSGELVDSAGRMAASANAIGDYFGRVDGATASRAISRLERRALGAADDQASLIYRTAASARERQLEHHRQLQGICERIQARLEVVLASLGNVLAIAVKIRVMDGAQLALAGGSVVEQLEALAEDERIVEAAVAEATRELGPPELAASPAAASTLGERLGAGDHARLASWPAVAEGLGVEGFEDVPATEQVCSTDANQPS